MKKTINSIVEDLKELGITLGVINTVSEEMKPEAAFVYFTIDDELNVYFATRAGSRKYKNLMKNPHAALS